MSVPLGPKLPRITLPKALDLPNYIYKPPTAKIPSYKPIVIPPSDLQPPAGVKAAKTTEQPEAPKLKIPVLDFDVPVPETAVVVTAVTTAVVAVATTSVTQTLFEPIKKKVQKFLQGKIDKWKKSKKSQKDS